MLFKSLEFKNQNGQKVKILEIPVLEEDSTFRFMIDIRLQAYMSKIYSESNPKKCYSFKDHLKKVLKWRDYEMIFQTDILRNNA